jgi:hypothetical protein
LSALLGALHFAHHAFHAAKGLAQNALDLFVLRAPAATAETAAKATARTPEPATETAEAARAAAGPLVRLPVPAACAAAPFGDLLEGPCSLFELGFGRRVALVAVGVVH